MRNPIPDILIEQAALGELSPEELEILKQECDLPARIAALAKSDREILNQYPPAAMADAIRQRLQAEQTTGETPNIRQDRNIQGIFRLALPLAAAAALFVAVGMPALQHRSMPSDDMGAMGIRLKGQTPLMHIYRQNSAQAELLTDRQPVKQNDLLQISYNAADARYGVILSIDGRGAVTLHFPVSPAGEQLLAHNGEYALPYSYQLDDAPNFERFYFISGQQPVPMDALLEEADRIAMSRTGKWADSFRLPDSYRQQSVLLLKEN